jgi:Flavodoxin reductases (ferredoxin-NADPH reductases) family 1
VKDLAYGEFIERILPDDEFIGEMVKDQLVYYPTVTREPFRNTGRITALMDSGKLFQDIGLPPMSMENDRFMLCGSPHMLADVRGLLDSRGWVEGNHGEQGHFVIEKAFVDK